MSGTELKVSVKLPAPPEQVQAAWLDGEAHGEMTGSEATGEPVVGAGFTAWDGYISGTNLEIGPGQVVQAWRTTEFAADAPDSRLEVRFEAVDGGCKLSILHTELPPGTAETYKQGWKDFYFKPMKACFRA